jgi:uncharacterized membrane protein
VAARPDHHSPFGQDSFGRYAETAARFFGTPQYIVGQTLVVILWVILNAVGIVAHWDPYPFILLNLAFSLQAAYAAPLILLAATRQAERDKRHTELEEHQHDEETRAGELRLEAIKRETDDLRALLQANTDLTLQDKELTEQVAGLTRQIHALLAKT